MTDTATSEDTSATTATELLAAIDRAQGLATAFKSGLTPYLKREAGHLEEDLEVLEGWATEVEDEGDNALAGGSVVADTARKRAAYFKDQIGDADRDLKKRLENLDEALEEVERHVDDFQITIEAYVTYVNRSFTARYLDATVTVGTMLADADREDVEELGLYPLDDLFGKAIPELAFPASKEVDLEEEHRIYWESESDGGSIA